MPPTVSSNDPAATEMTRGGESAQDHKGLLGKFGRAADGVATFLLLKSPDGAIRYLSVDNSNVITASATRP